MALLKIARMGHPVLVQRADEVPDPGAPDIRRLVADMVETMLDAPGIGLAGPQVHAGLRLFVYHLPSARTGHEAVSPRVIINPRLEPAGEEIVMGLEGCLSIPGLRAAVPRHARVRYAGVDCDGQAVEGEAEGLLAVVMQHEYDHLDGILYPMRVTDFTKFGFSEELAQYAPKQEAP